MADDSKKQAEVTLTRAADITDETHQAKAKMASTFALGLVDMAGTYGRSLIGTACLTAATMLILGRPLNLADQEVSAICEEFVDKLVAMRDVLREDATNTQAMPKGVM
jgi:hypothetical protein